MSKASDTNGSERKYINLNGYASSASHSLSPLPRQPFFSYGNLVVGFAPEMMHGLSSSPTYSAINELMRAVILRVIDDYNSSNELRCEALEYMWNEDEEYIFSFFSICNHLGLDPVKTREYIINPRHRIATRRRAG